MAIKRNNEIDVSPSADEIIQGNDIIVAIGGNQELNNIEKLVR